MLFWENYSVLFVSFTDVTKIVQQCNQYVLHTLLEGPSCSWSYDSWIYNYMCNQCLSPLKLWVRAPFMARCIQYNVIQWLVAGRWLSPGISVSSTNSTTDRYDITEILWKVAINTITQPDLISCLMLKLIQYEVFQSVIIKWKTHYIYINKY